MAKTIENLFKFLHLSSDILLIIVCLWFINRIRNERPLILVSVYALLDLLINIFNNWFSNHWWSYIWSTFTFVEYSIFTYILWINIRWSPLRKFIVIISILFIVFTTVFNIATNFDKIDSIPIGVETILLLVFSFYYLYEQMNESSELFIYSKYQFWIVIGFMIYLAGSFFVFLFANKLAENDVIKRYWFLTNCFYVLMNVLFIVSFFIHNKKRGKMYPPKLRPYLN
jgi:hypothetical protein